MRSSKLFRLSTTMLLCLAVPAAGQSVNVGVIVVDPTGRALPGVEVSIPSLKRTALTDATGHARLPGVDSGSYVIRARKLGFSPVAERVRVRPSAPIMTLIMQPVVVTLDTVRSIERCPARGYTGFECRQRQGKGVFLDLAAIDSAHVDDVAMLFYGRPDFKVERALRTGIPYVTSHYKGGRCMTVLVNGLPANATTNPAPRYAREIVAVEAFPNPQDVPKAYEAYTWTRMVPCGMVNYWTSKR